MVVEFDRDSWKKIMKVCSPAVSADNDRPALRLVRLAFDPFNPFCTAVGSNGYMICRAVVPCVYVDGDVPQDELFVWPEKTPTGTRSVRLSPDMDGGLVMSFLGADGKMLDFHPQVQPKDRYFDCDSCIKKTEEEIGSYDHGAGVYHIAVNPKYLIAALSGMKDHETVIFNFAGRNSAFTIRPFDGDDDVMALLLPVRTLV